ncbi:uncharacterized protein BJ212DRAFT_1484065 [Suillus subaureus]|uniref:Uncharacterized protein n=1 Tax=Suillus subaureus TaxID=48587 RepID=A0A9P7E4F6_9AGAM|nr:uncharacterized protein BJ212DRAFT_1484065 [Suillus subaureus]KAG1810937.1 hypothetical protein BJ212DRAFT_1484065 [Suillus subaureus]
MQYSSDDIAAAKSFQFATHMYASMATFWVYDYACSLHEEVIHPFRNIPRFQYFDIHRTLCKVDIFASIALEQGERPVYCYTIPPFILLTTNLYMNLSPNENPGRCRTLANIDSGIGMVSVICSECFFILRTYALWNNNKILLAAMMSTFFQAFIVACFTITFAITVPAAYATSAIPGITGCYQSSTSFQLFIPFLLLFAFELGLLILTLIRAIQSWRTNTNRLYVALVSHNISYYACGLLVNICTSLLLPYSYHSMLHDFQFMILAVLATRMHLHLWQMNQRAHCPGTFVDIPMSDISFVHSMP